MAKKKDESTIVSPVDLAISALEKAYGKGIVLYASDPTIVRDVPVISTGSIGLDFKLGCGGLPRGKIVEIYGPPGSGKTTLALQTLARAQQSGCIVAYIDAEHALDMKYAENLGIIQENLLLSQPDYGEQALEILDVLIRSNAIDAIVIDSVAALVPKAELEGEMGDVHIGLQARLMSQSMRKIAGITRRSNTLVIFINQTRSKIGYMAVGDTTSGGIALKFYASIRIDIRRIGEIKVGEEILGNRTKVKIVKNRLAPPFRECEFNIIYGKGVDKNMELFELGLSYKLIEKNGSWFSYKGQSIGQGATAAAEAIGRLPRLQEEVLKQLYGEEEDPTPANSMQELPGPDMDASPGETEQLSR